MTLRPLALIAFIVTATLAHSQSATPALTPGQIVPLSGGSAAAAVTSAAAPALAASCKDLVALTTALPASAPTVTLIRSSKDPLALHEQLTLEVKNPKPLVTCLTDSRAEPVLFVDHIPLPGLSPQTKIAAGSDEAPTLRLTYRLERTSAAVANWGELMLRDWTADKRPRPISLGIGPGPSFEAAVVSTSTDLQGQFGDGHKSWAVWALVIAAILFFVLSHWSSLLRDRAPKLATGPAATEIATYSLARVMMSCWVLTTTAAILLVYFSSGALPPLDGGVPLLLLASGVTVGTGAVIETVRRISVGKTAWFLEDMLTDRDGLALHRLQALLVNILLLVVVWQGLIFTGAIASIDRGWGVLMGISTGVYLYGKTTEAAN